MPRGGRRRVRKFHDLDLYDEEQQEYKTDSKKPQQNRGEDIPYERRRELIADIFGEPLKGLEIKPMKGDKDEIPQRKCCKILLLSPHPFVALMNGRSGSGKTTVMSNLLFNPLYFGPTEREPKGYFDNIFLYATTVKTDDYFQKLIDVLSIPEENIREDPKPSDIQKILADKKNLIQNEHDGHVQYAPKDLIIMDDIISKQRFLKSDQILQIFAALRHYGTSVFVCSQSFTKIPRACRMQASLIVYFQGTTSELDIICDEYDPQGTNRKKFRAMIAQATNKKHSFLMINTKAPLLCRYREGMTKRLPIEKTFDDEYQLMNSNQQCHQNNKKKRLMY